MKCNQCSNNAIGEVRGIPLCLNCYVLLQKTLNRNKEILREEINFLQDSIDSVCGFSTGARYPTKRPVMVSGGTVNNNHISINNSQIGVLNIGNINNLNQTIDSLYSASQKELADNIKNFSEALIKEGVLSGMQKNEVLESLDVITKELFQKPENRKKTLVNKLFNQISLIIGSAADSLVIWQALFPLLKRFFE